jgi:hypothetical protein
VEQPFELGQASLNGVPQVITWQLDSKGAKVPGLQLRQGEVSLAADLRLDNFTGSLPASGWDQNLTTTQQRLNLPPGYELYFVSGAKAFDRYGFVVPWWDRWTSLDLFIVLAIVITSFKLLGLRHAILAALALGLSYQEYMAPRLVILHILGATALLSVLPEKGKAKFITLGWRIIASIFLVVLAVLFIIIQARVAIYPQLSPIWVQRDSWGYPITQYLNRNQIFSIGSSSDDAYQYSSYEQQMDSIYEVEQDMQAEEPRSMAPMPSTSSGRSSRSSPKKNVASLSQQASGQQNSLFMTAPEARAQNTLARPNWEFRVVNLDYNGQVAKDQTVNLTIIGPRLSAILCLLRIVLMAWLVLAVISARGAINLSGLLGRLSRLFTAKAKTAVAKNTATKVSIAVIAVVSVMTALLLTSHPVLAQDSPELVQDSPDIIDKTQVLPSHPSSANEGWIGFPPPELLRNLQMRLLEREPVIPPGIPSLVISSPSPDILRLTFSIETTIESVIVLPELDPKVFQPTKVYIEDVGDLPILSTNRGLREVLVPAGIKALILEGRLAGVNEFQMTFPTDPLPGRVTLENLPSYSLAGLDRNGHPTGRSIFVYTGRQVPATPKVSKEAADLGSLTPDDETGTLWTSTSDGGKPSTAKVPLRDGFSQSDALKPFFKVDRTVSLGIEWKLYTVVSPLYPITGTHVLAIPLVPGEKPTSAGLTIRDGAVVFSFGPGTGTIGWESDLDINLEKPMVLEAGSGPYTESWSLDAANFWRVETSGLIPVYNVSPSGFWNPKWRPWPGESVSIAVSRPDPVPGKYLVIDKATLSVTMGQENRLNKLNFTLRSSFGGPFSFDLPPGSEIQTLTLDGGSLPSSSVSGPKVVLPLTPGQHQVFVTWLGSEPMGTIVSTPALNLEPPAANINYTLILPSERWTLMAGGPVQGPAVLFWSMAGAILIFSLLLGRLKMTPLGTVSWFLLFLGLAQLSIYGALLVTGWLLVLGLRGTQPRIKSTALFNLVQIGLVIWTILALCLIYRGLQHGLLEAPAMRVTGNGSTDHNLNWFADRASGAWPEAWVLTIPDRIYRYVMLAWALWLAISLIRWLKWIWNSFSNGGFWKKSPPKPPTVKNQPFWPGQGPPPGSMPPQGYAPGTYPLGQPYPYPDPCQGPGVYPGPQVPPCVLPDPGPSVDQIQGETPPGQATPDPDPEDR